MRGPDHFQRNGSSNGSPSPWLPREGSNLQPPDPESGVLPVELLGKVSRRGAALLGCCYEDIPHDPRPVSEVVAGHPLPHSATEAQTCVRSGFLMVLRAHGRRHPSSLLAGRQGLEPRSSAPKAEVLPLDDLPSRGPGGSRTPDTRIFSAVLYQLSYRSVWGPLTLVGAPSAEEAIPLRVYLVPTEAPRGGVPSPPRSG